MTPVPVTLTNTKTGKTVSCNSITAFCKKVHLDKNEVYHFSPLITGKITIYKGWVLPETYKKLAKPHDWEDIYGNRFDNLSVLQILQKKSKKISPSIKQFLNGEINGFMGLFLLSKKPDYVQVRTEKIWTLVKGETKFVGTVRRKLALQAGISDRSVADMARGLFTSVKGVRIHSIENREVKKSIL